MYSPNIPIYLLSYIPTQTEVIVAKQAKENKNILHVFSLCYVFLIIRDIHTQ